MKMKTPPGWLISKVKQAGRKEIDNTYQQLKFVTLTALLVIILLFGIIALCSAEAIAYPKDL